VLLFLEELGDLLARLAVSLILGIIFLSAVGVETLI